MAGLVTFNSIAEALRAGFQIYDKTLDGYIVRIQTQSGWALAIVDCRTKPSPSGNYQY